jgi:N-acetyl-gamma-glutamyl-phosphate reductase
MHKYEDNMQAMNSQENSQDQNRAHQRPQQTEATSKTQLASKEKLSVAIIGARGYSGLELAGLLLGHPAFQLTAISANSAFKLGDELPLPGAETVPFLHLEQMLQSRTFAAVFLATPVEASLELAPKFLSLGAHVIDLSGAFRLKRGGCEAYVRWYKMTHDQAELLARAEYGLQPWCKAQTSLTPRLIANPGCYASACLLALLPLLRMGLIDARQVVIDAKSGASGAGRKANEEFLFSEVADDCRPYKVGEHQHTPEIIEAVQNFAAGGGEDVGAFAPAFATHLLPIRRGIIASIYAGFTSFVSAGKSDAELESLVADSFREFYGNYPLIRFSQMNEGVAKALLSLRSVAGTPYCNLVFKVKDGRLYLFSLLDNLLKGAASQAVENLNQIYSLPLETGLYPASSVNASVNEMEVV